MLRAPEREYLERLFALGVHPAGEVVELRDLPAAGLRDPAFGPCEHLVIEPELGHRLGDPNELVRVLQVPTELLHDRVDVAVEDREPLAGVAHGERVGAFVPGNRLSIRSQPEFAEGARVAHGIDFEEVLIGESEFDHPVGELEGISDARVACPCVQVEQVSGEISDLPVGVVRVEDHLDDVTDRALQQLDQFRGRRALDHRLEFAQDRAGRLGPSSALAVAEEPPRAKPAVHLGAQLRQVAFRASGDQPHVPLNIVVEIDCGRDNLVQLVDGHGGDQLLDRRLLPDAFSSTRHARHPSPYRSRARLRQLLRRRPFEHG